MKKSKLKVLTLAMSLGFAMTGVVSTNALAANKCEQSPEEYCRYAADVGTCEYLHYQACRHNGDEW
jgi:ABC-type nickel/cobalt efflux system permease component RcnA